MSYIQKLDMKNSTQLITTPMKFDCVKITYWNYDITLQQKSIYKLTDILVTIRWKYNLYL